MQSLEEYIGLHAARTPGKVAVRSHTGECLTYGQLWLQIQQRAELLSGSKALVARVRQTADFLADYLAAHLAGVAAVPLEADLPEDAFNDICRTVDAADIPAGTADILFTTGTTGVRKGVVMSHRALLADTENLAEAQGFSQGLTMVVCGPLNHIGSLSKVWPTLMCGATVHILEGIKDMDAFFRVVEAAPGRSATFLVPASIRMLLKFGRRQLAQAAPRLDFIETGAAPISQADMEELCALLPDTRLYNTYASTETGIVCTHDYNAGPCIAGCLGRPMRHSRLHIDADGRISVSGDTVMTGYLGHAEATARVLREGTVHTSDRGRLDTDGRLHLTGREGDVINVGGFKVNPVEVEDAARTYPGVADCVCTTATHPVLGTVLRLVVAAEPGARIDRKALARHLKARLESHKVPLVYETADSIRRTYNGKLDRKHYTNG